jgi:hypothetical protein
LIRKRRSETLDQLPIVPQAQAIKQVRINLESNQVNASVNQQSIHST